MYDTNDDVYHLWLSGSIQSWGKSQNMKYPTTLYDENDPSDPINDLISGVTTTIGSRFEVIYTQSSSTASLQIFIGSCSISLTIDGYGFIDGRYRAHTLYVTPPQCMFTVANNNAFTI